MKYLLLATSLVLGLLTACQDAAETSNQKQDKTKYEVVFREKLAGSYEKWKIGENNYGYHYAYTDRGRGPDLEEEIQLNDQQFIVKQTISGVNYRKATVEEKFECDKAKASWLNPQEENEADFDPNKLYFRYDGSPAIYEILAWQLLATESKKVDLYPVGTAELVAQFPFELSDDRAVELMMIKGLDMNPTFLWMMGTDMVGKITNNRHVIREDFSSLRLEMKALQDQVEDDFLAEAAKNLTHDLGQAIITNVNVFTEEGTLLLQQDVWVDEQRIKTIEPHKQQTIPEEVLVIDGEGKTLMPGLFDMHTHNTKFRGILHLAGGVTSVRDLANNKQLKALSAQFNKNEILGPRIVTFCGIIDGSGPFANQRNVVDNLEEGLAEVEDYKKLGYQQIKLYSSIRPEWVGPLVEKAHGLGMRVSGHIPAYMTATQAINEGYNEIQHMNMLFLNFLSDTIDTRTPLRHTMPAQHGADLDLNSQEYLDFVQLLKTKDILVDPTLAIFENMYIAQKGEPSPTYSQIIDRLPVMNQRGFYSGGLQKSGEKVARYKESFNRMLEVLVDLFQKDITVVPGTDGLPGFLYHRELELYAGAGIPNAEVLKLATIKSAKITGMADELGSIKVGKKADLILIDGNPLENMSDVRKVECTMKEGKLYYVKELYNSMGIKHFKQ
ncbi:MAG: amidohydrolase family protein [Saprospiraceae bacterium]|nr:amidohydrolase family protein [Saprospiraceae bacterium]